MMLCSKGVLKKVTTAIVLLTLVAFLLPDISGYVLNLNQVKKGAVRNALLYLWAISIILMVFFSVLERGWKFAISLLDEKPLLYAVFFVALSSSVNLTLPRPMLFFAFAALLFLIVVMPRARIVPPIALPTYALVAASVIPICMDLVCGPIYQFYSSESFRGYFDSRTDYAYVCGISIILIFMAKKPWLLAMLPLLATYFAFTGSRTGMLAVTISIAMLCFSFYRSRFYLYLTFAIATLVWVWFAIYCLSYIDFFGHIRNLRLIGIDDRCRQTFSSCVGVFSDTGGRMEIYRLAFQEAIDHFLFGKGDYFQTILVNNKVQEAHNGIIQSVINFGFFAALAWYVLISKIFLNVSFYGKTLLVFWLCFGMFEPGIDAFLFYPANFLLLLIAHGIPSSFSLSNHQVSRLRFNGA